MQLRAAGAALAALTLASCTSATNGSPETTGTSRSPSASSAPLSALPTSSTSASASRTSASPSTRPAFADPAAAAKVLAAARSELAAVNSYDYRTLAADRTRALAATTGALTGRVSQAYRDEIGRYAPGRKATQKADFGSVGLESVQGGHAAVLAFGTVHDTSASGSSTSPRADVVTAAAQLELVGGTWLLSDLSSTPTLSLPPAGTTPLTVAFAAARSAVPDLSTFSATDFRHDYARALVATTGAVHRDLVRERSALETSVVGRHENLSAELTGLAVEKVQPDAVTFLATENISRARSGSRAASSQQRAVLTLVPVSGQWLIADLTVAG